MCRQLEGFRKRKFAHSMTFYQDMVFELVSSSTSIVSPTSWQAFEQVNGERQKIRDPSQNVTATTYLQHI
jgi:hypothetical protein